MRPSMSKYLPSCTHDMFNTHQKGGRRGAHTKCEVVRAGEKAQGLNTSAVTSLAACAAKLAANKPFHVGWVQGAASALAVLAAAVLYCCHAERSHSKPAWQDPRE